MINLGLLFIPKSQLINNDRAFMRENISKISNYIFVSWVKLLNKYPSGREVHSDRPL